MNKQSMDCRTSSAQPRNTNLIGAEQWNASWEAIASPIRLRPWRDYTSWLFDRFFRDYIRRGDRVLEVGCGGSRLLPYFAKDLGAEVWGFDFAPAGVASAKAALARAGVAGTIKQGKFTFRGPPHAATSARTRRAAGRAHGPTRRSSQRACPPECASNGSRALPEPESG